MSNKVLRFPTIYNIPISKDEMNQIVSTGLIKGIDKHGFVLFDNDNLSGSHVHWSNLKEIRTADDGQSLLLIYNNLADEILPNHYEFWNDMIKQIPEDFGDFQHLLKSENSGSSVADEVLEDIDEAKEMLSDIERMRADFMGEEEEDEPEEVIDIPEPTLEEVPVFTSDFEESQPEEEKKEEAVPPVSSEPAQMSNKDLLRKILAEAEADGKYTSSNLRFSSDEGELNANTKFQQNATIQNPSSLGFEVIAGGKTHKIDFGKFSDAYYDGSKKCLVLEHRYGKTLSLPQQMEGWKKLIQTMPFRFRSFDRKQMWELSK